MEYEACGESKAKRQIHRQRRKFLEGPGERLVLDFYDFQRGYDGYTTLMLIIDRWLGLIWDYYIKGNYTTEDIITALKSLFGMLFNQYRIKPKVIECDNELTQTKPGVGAWLERKDVKVEPSAPDI